MPQIATTLLPKASVTTTNLAFDPLMRTKSANSLARQRSGLMS
jgi:hypothetical protein